MPLLKITSVGYTTFSLKILYINCSCFKTLSEVVHSLVKSIFNFEKLFSVGEWMYIFLKRSHRFFCWVPSSPLPSTTIVSLIRFYSFADAKSTCVHFRMTTYWTNSILCLNFLYWNTLCDKLKKRHANFFNPLIFLPSENKYKETFFFW